MQNDKAKFKSDLKFRIYRWVLRLIAFLDTLPKDVISQRISDQLFRNGSSIGANYIEAQAASSKKDFVNFFQHALKSANESKFWLVLLRDTKRGSPRELQEILQELIEIANILGSSVITAKGKRRE